MKQLRDRVVADRYLDEVQRQRGEGYRLFAGSADAIPVALLGIRHTHTLARGEHIFVDDLIVDAARRGSGIGKEMLIWLARWTREHGCPMIYLDSRDTAKGFYAALGFKYLTSAPCFITAEMLTESAR